MSMYQLGDSVTVPPREEFTSRHIGPRADEQAVMLAALGCASIDELMDQTVPAAIRASVAPDAESQDAYSELGVIARLREIASKNRVVTSMIGQGYSNCQTPTVLRRKVFENPAWYTAYTPYQPEISQGRLEALLNFQTMITDLTGMDVASASMLDEASAAAEAMALAHRQSKSKSRRFIVDEACHPQVIAVVETRAEPIGVEVDVMAASAIADAASFGGGAFGALLAWPSTGGELVNHAETIAAVQAASGLACVSVDLLCCVIATPPGEIGADVVVGSAQRFGVPLGFGGPHAGFLACKDAHKRSMPGRLVGVSVDTKGRRGLRLALQTREQHIRREKATSNICTAQVLLAVMASMYAVWHGPDGLRRIALHAHSQASRLRAALVAGGVEVANDTWFDTLSVVVSSGDAGDVVAAAERLGVNLRRIDDDHVGVACDETTTDDHLRDVLTAFGVYATADALPDSAASGIRAAQRRTTPVLAHPVFSSYRSETDVLRYLRYLADQDLALDRTMIPLGSCTMKLNAATEMEPISWPDFAGIHPFAPASQTEGYRQLITELEERLAHLTGYDQVSLQPNAGSQGEFAGLLAIRAYHRSRGEQQRDVCLIPSSAHGTNAASAAMCGMRVVVVGCDDHGNVDLADLDRKIADHSGSIAALMITYPSTHGVFETEIVSICEKVHEAGGQVYLDGANFNALAGVARPGKFGADVSHLNLHKTFAIPHGGGGPGVGPVCVREHLAPFLPGHPSIEGVSSMRWAQASNNAPAIVGALTSAAYGSASVLPISHTYISLMGDVGLREATEAAILNANYLAARLNGFFPVLYTGTNGRVAHECILDLRPITAETGVTVDDVAKRLIDYGFHAPTMSFPVAGTLMVEPTESESLIELDRFCDAMIAIRAEIDKVASGVWPADDNPLHNAPHTAADVITEEWTHPYSRELASVPGSVRVATKYWPPVSRIDGAYGDRNVVCTCPPIDAYT